MRERKARKFSLFVFSFLVSPLFSLPASFPFSHFFPSLSLSLSLQHHFFQGDGGVAYALYGDGAANQGQIAEAFNIAALWQLPVVFVCENNHYGMGTAEWRGSKSSSFYTRGDYMPGLLIDGMDVLAVKNGEIISFFGFFSGFFLRVFFSLFLASHEARLSFFFLPSSSLPQRSVAPDSLLLHREKKKEREAETTPRENKLTHKKKTRPITKKLSGVAFAKEHALKNGPIVLEMDTYRYHGHSMSDPGSTYRTRDEVAGIRQNRDPVEGVRRMLLDKAGVEPGELKKIEKAVKAEVDAAVEQAKKDPAPPSDWLSKNVYVDSLGATARGVESGTVYKL